MAEQPVSPGPAPARKRRRWPWVAGAVLLLPLALVFIGPALIPSGWLTSQIEAQLRQHLKRPVHFEKVKISTLWGVKVTVHGVTVDNRAGFGAKPLVHVNRVELGVSLFPLFQKRVVVDHLRVIDVEACLEKRGARANWDELVDARERLPADRGEPRVQQAGMLPPGLLGASDPVLQLAANEITFRNIAVEFTDLELAETTRLSGLDLDLAIERFDLPGKVTGPLDYLLGLTAKGEARFAGVAHPAMSLADGTFGFGAKGGAVTLDGGFKSGLGGGAKIKAQLEAREVKHSADVSFDQFTFGSAFSNRYLAGVLAGGASGKLNGGLKLQAQGLEFEKILKSAIGEGTLRCDEVKFKEISGLKDLIANTEKAVDLLKGEIDPQVGERVKELSLPATLQIQFNAGPQTIVSAVTFISKSHQIKVPGEIDKRTLNIHYVIGEQSFSDPSLKKLWKDYVGQDHAVVGTVFQPDFDLAGLSRVAAKKRASEEIGSQIEKGIGKLFKGKK